MRLKIFVVIGITVLSCSAHADPMIGSAMSVYSSAPEEGLQLALNESLVSDSNIFRLPDGAYPPGSTKRSDTINTQQADLSYNKFYGIQSISLDATLAHNTFNNFSYLDYNTTNYKGLWAWKVDKDLSGTLGASENQTLTNFATFQGFSKNVTTVQSKYFNGDYWLTGPWHALFGVAANQTKYSLSTIEQQNMSGNFAEAGMSYVTEAQNTISLKARHTRGTYTGLQLNTVQVSPGIFVNTLAVVDNSYSQQDEELNVIWNLSGKSMLTGQLKHFSQTYDFFQQRDYGGMAGNLNYLWALSGKTQINFTAQRSFNQYQTLGSSYYVNDEFAIAPAWQVSPKVTLRMVLDRASLDYLGAITSGSAYGRRDVTQTVMAAADWAPTRKITFSASVQHTTRDSNLNFQYGDTALNVIAQIAF